MNGYNVVYRRPDGEDDFFRDKVRVAVTYSTRNNYIAGTTSTREDIWADIQAGTLRRHAPRTNVEHEVNASNGSILTLTNSNNWQFRERPSRSQVWFRGIDATGVVAVPMPVSSNYGDDSASVRRVRNGRLDIGVLNYVRD